ncbi:hypothetical protein QJS10_CPA05g01237 [Acorus calamus]|uniref:Pseudouridine synthase RsuA/RluA-like domain-containing protein n=1 Tax=Acorus calamus TaxID=4465 RepID=A0AAV9ETY3_ACOCL|nr:hypothetical protein QJS10_CPA05g01237 [Acorus calamus]
MRRSMSELFLHRRIPSSVPLAAAAAAEIHITSIHRRYSSSASGEELLREEKRRWLTLPPFRPPVDAAVVGRALSVRGSSLNSETVTALKWVLHCCPQIPRCLVQKLFRLRRVRRESTNSNNASCLDTKTQHRLNRVSAKDIMSSGDRIFLPNSIQEFQSKKKEYCFDEDDVHYIRNLELYKDSAIVVVNKPPGMPVQGGIGIKRSMDVLAAAALRYDLEEPPRLVHRLDKDSSGILVMGRTQISASVLHFIFREKTFEASNDDTMNTQKILQKKYWALVLGVPRLTKGLISAPLTKVVMDNGKSDRIKIVDNVETTSSQHALTEYRVIGTSVHGYTWLELCPLTGRKHQLRVHCAEVLGTPIVGDYKYGWQVHKKWKPIHCLNLLRESDNHPNNAYPHDINLEGGSIAEKQPLLHLHCRQMIFPNVSLALELMKSSVHEDLSQLEKLDLVAPLPLHMQRSWDILRSL